MKYVTASKRYGRAAFELAIEQNCVEELYRDTISLKNIIIHVPEFISSMNDKRLGFQLRSSILNNVSNSLGLSLITKNLCRVLLERERVEALLDIVENIEKRFLDYKHIISAKLTVADVSVSDEIVNKVSDAIKSVLGKESKCEVAVDNSIVSGFVLQIGDSFMDESLSGKIESMKESIINS